MLSFNVQLIVIGTWDCFHLGSHQIGFRASPCNVPPNQLKAATLSMLMINRGIRRIHRQWTGMMRDRHKRRNLDTCTVEFPQIN